MTIEQERLTPTQEDLGALRAAIDAGLQAFCANTPDFAMSAPMRRDAADFILGQPALRVDLPADVRRLVLAARVVAFEDVGMEAMAELDDASEAFADRVKWDDEPAEECVGGVIGAMKPDHETCALCDGKGTLPSSRARAAERVLSSKPTTSGDVGKLCERLKAQAQLASDASKMLAQAKSLRQTDNPEGRDDLYSWEAPEHTLYWETATLLTQMEAREQALREALADCQDQLNWTDASPLEAAARVVALEKALERIEAACDTIAALRTQEMYLAMIDAGQEDALSELGDARQAARALLNPTPTEER